MLSDSADPAVLVTTHLYIPGLVVVYVSPMQTKVQSFSVCLSQRYLRFPQPLAVQVSVHPPSIGILQHTDCSIITGQSIKHYAKYVSI